MKNNCLKKNVKTSLGLGVLLFCFFFFSCQKEVSQYLTGGNGGGVKADTVSPYNEDNPYDSVGIRHNIGLNAFMVGKTCYWFSNVDLDDLISFGEYYDSIYEINGYGIQADLTNEEFWAYINSGKQFQSHMNAYASDTIIDIFARVINDINCGEFSDYNDVKNRILLTEDSVIDNLLAVTKSQEAVLLSSLSVLRHSIFYWSDENTNSGYHTAPFVASWSDILFIGCADAFGALLGKPLTGSLIAVAIVAVEHHRSGDTIAQDPVAPAPDPEDGGIEGGGEE